MSDAVENKQTPLEILEGMVTQMINNNSFKAEWFHAYMQLKSLEASNNATEKLVDANNNLAKAITHLAEEVSDAGEFIAEELNIISERLTTKRKGLFG